MFENLSPVRGATGAAQDGLELVAKVMQQIDVAPTMENKAMLDVQLGAAADAARNALDAVKPLRSKFLQALSDFEKAVGASAIDNSSKQTTAAGRKAVEAFSASYDALRKELDSVTGRYTSKLNAAFSDLEQDARFVTIMLFGRTRAGKSTTMEALTGGEGATIGVGKQHTTTQTKAYFFPNGEDGGAPLRPALRIVDTPGIEGYAGDDLALMAEGYVERADQVLFLLTDDKATSAELEHFGKIHLQGKAVTVLLNIKSSDDDLDLLTDDPSLVFKSVEIEGHTRRISGYLERRFNMRTPRIIPYHARAAWMARSTRSDVCPPGIARERLLAESRFNEIEAHILHFIQEDALPARIRAPRELLNQYLWPLKDDLRPFVHEFQELINTLDALCLRLERGTEKARKRIAARFPLIRARFQAVNDAIPGLVDSVITLKGNGAALGRKWSELLESHGVREAVPWFLAEASNDFERELSEQVRTAKFDFELSGASGLGAKLDQYHEKDTEFSQQRYVRAGVRAGTATVASGLTGWAITNFWNPTGWLALAGAAVLTIGAGLAGEALGREVTDRMENRSKNNMRAARDSIITDLRERLWSDYDKVRQRCGDWLDSTKQAYLTTANETVRPIKKAATRMASATKHCLHALDDIANENDYGLISDLMRLYVPDVANGRISIMRIARQPGLRTKILLQGDGTVHNSVGACIGHAGHRVEKLRVALGGERIDFVDMNAGAEVSLAQAIGVKDLRPDQILIKEPLGSDRRSVNVRLEEKATSRVIGPHGINVRLASALLGIHIVIGGKS